MLPKRALLLATLLAGCSSGGSGPPATPKPFTVSMVNTAWRFQHSPTMPAMPFAQPPGWVFDFPMQDGVHYLVHSGAGYLGSKMSISYRVEGDGELVETQPCPGASSVPLMRLYFQRRGDDLTASKQHYRWWSVGTLIGGEITVSLQPDNWSSVFGIKGSAAPSEFAAAKADAMAVGVTFGGCFAGHGVYLKSGSLKFIATGFSVN